MTGRDDSSMDEILGEIRRIAAGDEGPPAGPDAPAAGGPAPPRPLSERGGASFLLALAILIPSLLLGLELLGLTMAAIGIPPDAAAYLERGSWVVGIILPVLFVDARPAGTHGWIVLAAATVAITATAIASWAAAAGVLLHFMPDPEPGFAVTMLLGVSAILGGRAAFLVAHRLAGRHSPWREYYDKGEGGGRR